MRSPVEVALQACRSSATGAIFATMNEAKIDEAVLALLYLNHWLDKRTGVTTTWKTFDWDAMERLHKQGLISDPVSKSKVVGFSDEGLGRAREAFAKLFEN